VRNVSCRVDDDRLRIALDVAEDADASLEVYTAEERKGLLEDALGVGIEFTAEPDPVA
jgi:hypothetical protein